MKLSLLAGTALLALARAVPSNYTVVDVFPALATAPPVPSASPALAVVDNHAPWGNNTALAPSICFRTGPIVDPTNIQPHMQATCKRFVGIYARHENRQACVMDDGGVMWNFALQRLGDKPKVMTVQECLRGMSKQISCRFGGSTSYYHWKYT